MIHTADIEEALAHDDTALIEGAFRSLVNFPNGEPIEGAGTVDVLCSLLARVSRALRHDQSAMPAGMSATISAVLTSPIDAAASYAAGSKVVLDHQYHWRGRYLQHALSGGTLS